MSYQEFDAQEEIKSIWVHIRRLTNEIKILANKLSSQLEAKIKPANGKTITDLKQEQNFIKIYGHDGYNNGIWKLEIFDSSNRLVFEYKIKNTDSDKDYTFEEFLEEAMIKYNASCLSV